MTNETVETIRFHKDGYERYYAFVAGVRVTIEKSSNPQSYACLRWSAYSAGFPSTIQISGFTLKDIRRKLVIIAKAKGAK